VIRNPVLVATRGALTTAGKEKTAVPIGTGIFFFIGVVDNVLTRHFRLRREKYFARVFDFSEKFALSLQ